jgi:hypothetical protein
MKTVGLNKRHNHEEKIRSLRLLESNNFNYLATSRQTGIARRTLKQWEDRYGMEVFNTKSPTEKALESLDEEIKRHEMHIHRYLHMLQKQILNRIKSLVETEKKLEAIVIAGKFISEEIQKLSNPEEQVKNKISDPMAFVQLISNQIKSRNSLSENEEEN